jgi:hypothetical protein
MKIEPPALSPKPSTRNPKPETGNPKYSTRNTKPETRNAPPQRREWTEDGQLWVQCLTLCRANLAHIRQSGPDSGRDFQVKARKTVYVVPSSTGKGRRTGSCRCSMSLPPPLSPPYRPQMIIEPAACWKLISHGPNQGVAHIRQSGQHSSRDCQVKA